jgi:hypothetical protein
MKLIHTDLEHDTALALFEEDNILKIMENPAVEASLVFDHDEEPGAVVQELLGAISSLVKGGRADEWRVYNIETGGDYCLYVIVNRFQAFRFN